MKDNFNTINADEKAGLKCAFFNQYDLTDFIRLSPELFDKYFNLDNQLLEEKAKKLLLFLESHYYEVYRGAILYDNNITAVFRNDGYTRNTQKSIKSLRLLLKANKAHEICMAISKETGSWYLFIQSSEAEFYHEKIWELYPGDKDYKKGAMVSSISLSVDALG